MKNSPIDIDDIVKLGEIFYFNHLKNKLEKKHTGEYVVIDVEQQDYEIDADRLKALQKAEKKFGVGKLFYIAQIGTLQKQNIHYRENTYAWHF